MEVGVMFAAGDGAIDIARVARAAEERGFGSLWVGDHMVLPLVFEREHAVRDSGDPYELLAKLSSPIVALARAAAVTERLKVGTGICLPNLREPISLAKDVATLDSDSGGRFLFGVGGGWFREEMEVMGGDFERRGRQLADSVAAMKALWTQDEASHEGPYYNFSRLRLQPKPHQKPHPPILLAGDSQRIFNRVVAWADGWMPTVDSAEYYRQLQKGLHETAAKADRDPASIIEVAFGVENALRDAKELAALRDLGVDHAMLWIIPRGEDVLRELDTFERIVRELD